jgi:uncharacterized protein YlxW (UPF0749 family)
MSGLPREPGGDPAPGPATPGTDAAVRDPSADEGSTSGGGSAPVRRRWVSLTTGVLAVVLGFALTVQIRTSGESAGQVVSREEDLVTILEGLDSQEEQLRQQLAERRRLVEELGTSQLQDGRALTEAQERAAAIAVLNGSAPARGPGLRVTIQDAEGAVSAGILLDAIQELRGAGAEAIQVDGVRIVVSSYVGGDPGELAIDGQPITAPYDFRVIGPPDDLDVALNVPGGVTADVARFGGTTRVQQSDEIVVDAVRPSAGE